MVAFSKSTGKGRLEGSFRIGLAILGVTVIAARVQLYKPRNISRYQPTRGFSGGTERRPLQDIAGWDVQSVASAWWKRVYPPSSMISSMGHPMYFSHRGY